MVYFLLCSLVQKMFYKMHYIIFFLLKLHEHLAVAAWNKTKFQSVFFLFFCIIFMLLIINLQMSTECEVAFNTAKIIFYLIYYLSIPDSNQNPSHIPLEDSL